MPTLYYKDALKAGQKEFRSCTARGQYPYLPALDSFVPTDRINRGVSLGTIQIPLEFVVGTRSAGRTQAFARNFMPIMEDGSEFSDKWKHLCQAHVEEGIRDPIKVYEYLNRFYVEEGNKRVSVLKFFEADNVYANVIRVLPERNGSPEVELYYEFVDFYTYSKVNTLEFSKPGSFVQFQRCLGKAPGEVWTDEDRLAFNSVFYFFRQAYEAMGGRRLSSTVGDALLAYIRVYGYQDLRGKTAAEIRKSVKKAWEEITLQQEKPAIDVKMDPQGTTEEKGKNLISKVLTKSDAKKIMRVAFIHDKTPELSGWTYSHELGRQYLQRVFKEEIVTTAYFNAMESDPQAVIEQAIKEGNTVVFTTSPVLLPASLRAAVDHPDLTILNCSLNKSHRYIRTYYARMYEAKFVTGAIAGALAGADDVGYICNYPIFGMMAGINAFALGVQMTSPTARVHLEWSSVGGIKAATRRLTEKGIRLISSQDMARQDPAERETFGLSLVNESGQVNLAMTLWQWGVYYEAILRRIRSRSFQAEYEESSKALNYYWGLSAGVVDVRVSDKLPDSTKRLAMLVRESIRNGSFQIFQGPLYDQSGQQKASKGQIFTPEQIINMEWLNENLVGSIPTLEQLDQTGKETVHIVGVEPSKSAD